MAFAHDDGTEFMDVGRDQAETRTSNESLLANSNPSGNHERYTGPSRPHESNVEVLGPQHPLRKYLHFPQEGGKVCDIAACKQGSWGSKTSSHAVWKHIIHCHDEIWRQEVASGNAPLKLVLEYPVALPVASPYDPESVAQHTRQAVLTRFLVKKNLPLSLLEDEETIQFLHAFDPRFVVPSVDEITDKDLEQKRLQKMSEISNELQDPGNTVWVTADGWTSAAKVRYLTMTAHVLKRDDSRAIFALGLFQFPGTHNAQHIVDQMDAILQLYGTSFARIAGITSDGEPNMKDALKLLQGLYPRLLTIICVIHTLQLIPEHAKKVSTSFGTLLDDIKKCFGHYCNSPKLEEVLIRKQREVNPPSEHTRPLKPSIPDDTCWDNDFVLLRRAGDLAPYLDKVKHEIMSLPRKQQPKAVGELDLSASNRALLRPLEIALGFFEDATKEFSKEDHCLRDVPAYLQQLQTKMKTRLVKSSCLRFVDI